MRAMAKEAIKRMKESDESKKENSVLGVHRFDFHLSSFNRVVITLPVIPVHTVTKRRVFALKIAAVQVGL